MEDIKKKGEKMRGLEWNHNERWKVINDIYLYF